MERVPAPRAPLLLALLLAGCATAPQRPAVSPPPSDLRQLLIDPTAGAAGDDFDAVRRIHAALLTTGDAAAAEATLLTLLERRPDFAPARVALAQALLVGGKAPYALAEVQVAGAAAGTAARLVEARALEVTGRIAEAALAYAEVAPELAAAREAAQRLAPEAGDRLAARVAAALDRGRVDEARAALLELEKLQPGAVRTLELDLAWAQAAGDAARELETLRRLTPGAQGSLEWRLRRAELELELELGEPADGLSLVQGLAGAAAAEPALAERVHRAQFRWRVLNAPESVRRAARVPQLSRADAATLLYWLVPRVRTQRGGEARIASDILEHPAREEIARVVNLGLLGVDETLHVFSPERPIRRSELLRALVELASWDGGTACAGGKAAARAGGEALCVLAAECGLIPEAAECLGGGTISGPEALEWLRRALDREGQP